MSNTAYETPFNKAVLETLQNIAAALEGIRYQLSIIASPPEVIRIPSVQIDSYTDFAGTEALRGEQSGEGQDERVILAPQILESPYGLATSVTLSELPVKQDPQNV